MYVRDAVCNDRVFLGPVDVLDTGNCSILNTPWDLLPMASYDPALCLGGKQIQASYAQQMALPALPPMLNQTGQPSVVPPSFDATTTTTSGSDATPTKKRRVMKRSVDGREKD